MSGASPSIGIIFQRAINVPKARGHQDAKDEIRQNIRNIREHQRRPPIGLSRCSRTGRKPSALATKRKSLALNYARARGSAYTFGKTAGATLM